jgi:hypothetical protein
VFTEAHHLTLSWASPIQSRRFKLSVQVRGPLRHLGRYICLQWAVVNPTQDPHDLGPPLVGCPQLLNIFPATLYICRQSFSSATSRCAVVTRDSLNMESQSALFSCILFGGEDLYTGTRTIDIERLLLTILRTTKHLEHMSIVSSIWLSQRERADIETQEMHTKYLSKTQSAREKTERSCTCLMLFGAFGISRCRLQIAQTSFNRSESSAAFLRIRVK